MLPPKDPLSILYTILNQIQGTGLHLETFPRGGGGGGGAQQAGMRSRGGGKTISMHAISRGGLGVYSPRNFCILDSRRLLLVHSQELHFEYLIS